MSPSLSERRAIAERAWRDHGWPASRLESWRHTKLRAFAAAAGEAELSGGDWGPSPATDGAEIADLREAMAAGYPAVHRWLGTVARLDRAEDALNARNLGAFRSGRLIRVARGARIERSIDFGLRARGGGPSLVQRALIVCEPKSEATVCLELGGDGGAYTRELLIEVVLEAGARLALLWLQDEGASGRQLGAIAVHQHRDSHLDGHVIQAGAAMARVETRVHLLEPGASCRLDGLYIGTDRQHLDNHLEVHHEAAHTHSSMLYKGILDDRSTGVFRGKVRMRAGASKSTTEQLNRNLLLSDSATAHTKPQLEIDHDDVRASHGATVGELDREALFYLRSRGLDRSTARRLLTTGFAAEVIDRIPLPALRERLVARLAGMLG